MADYDVGVLSLSSPPPSAPVSTYRPAVLVRNNGIHDALVSGILRIYSAGLLTFQTELYSASLSPGASGAAQAVDYWTPSEGVYDIIANVSCLFDQDETNNHLAPTWVTISGAAPTPPTPILPHASQHEEGGNDEVSIDGLVGLTLDPQTPRPHAADHQAGGGDAINVASLLGQLANDQPALAHGNDRHSPSMALASSLSQHQAATTVHSAALNLASRVLYGPEAGLVPSLQLSGLSEVIEGRAFLGRDRIWQVPVPAGLICVWDGSNQIPEGWITVLVTPPLGIPYIYIAKQLAAP